MAFNKENKLPIAAKAIQKNFYRKDFNQSVDTPREAINFFEQLKPLLSKLEVELKMWNPNSIRTTEEFHEDMTSVSKAKQVEIWPRKVGFYRLEVQWNFTEYSLKVCKRTSKNAETSISQRKILSPVFSAPDPLGLFAKFTVHLRGPLTSI